jgi:hypothetical protein
MVDEAMLAQFRRLKETFRDPLEGTIYHYTSAEGFRGIVTSGEIWLTNAAFVNDPTECKLFWDEAVSFLLRRGRLRNQYVERLLVEHKRPPNDTYYLASFSRKPDFLPQYRAYGNICIGFDARRMKGIGFDPYKCVYTEQAIEDWL